MSLAVASSGQLLFGWPVAGWRRRWHDLRRIEEPFSLAFPESRNMVPIIGESGCGKSTLIYVLAGIKRPIEGEVTWSFPDGEAVSFGAGRPLPRRQLQGLRRRRFRVLFQDSRLMPTLTVLENLIIPQRMNGTSHRDAAVRASDALDRLFAEDKDRETIPGKLFGLLSGGQRQRIALAQALLPEPTVVFADEPTSNLDPDNRKLILKYVAEWLAKRPGERAFVWVSHDAEDQYRRGAETGVAHSAPVRLSFKDKRNRPEALGLHECGAAG